MTRKNSKKRSNSRTFVNSVARALSIMEALSEAKEPLNLTELARRVNLSNVTTLRFCNTLMELGYLHRNQAKRFTLTPRVLSLGYGALCQLTVKEVAEPYLKSLSESIGETVNMTILDGTEILYVARYTKEDLLSQPLYVGARLPLYCTSMGKAILAFLPKDEQRSLISKINFVKLTHRTITTADALLKELENVRKKGYAINDEELSVGLRSIGAPVLKRGRAVAAVNIAVPTTRYSRQKMINDFKDELMKTTRTISKILEKQITVQRI